MLQGYFDDSGSHDYGGPFVLGGYMLDAEKWCDFSDEWDKQLARSPAIEYLKMTEASERKGQFAGWNPLIRNCKLKELFEVIKTHDLDGFYCWLSWDDWNATIAPQLIPPLRNPYGRLFYKMMDLLHYHSRRIGNTLPIDLDFDEQGSAGQLAIALYPLLKSAVPAETAALMGRTPTLLDDKKVLPLQAADMLAWNMRRRLSPPSNDNFQWLEQLLYSTVVLSGETPGKVLKDFADGLNMENQKCEPEK